MTRANRAALAMMACSKSGHEESRRNWLPATLQNSELGGNPGSAGGWAGVAGGGWADGGADFSAL